MFLPQILPDRYRTPIIQTILAKIKSIAVSRYNEITYGLKTRKEIPLWELLLMEEIIYAKVNNDDVLSAVPIKKIEPLFEERLQKI